MASTHAAQSGDGASAEVEQWTDRSRVVLQPIAAPSILGLFGFAGATFMVAGNEAWNYGGSDAGNYLAWFAATFGGIAQFMAGMWAYRARDAVATAAHGTWGAFWIAYGLIHVFYVTGVLAQPSGDFVEFGYWFVVLSAITFSCAMAAHGENLGIALVLHTLWIGAGLLAVSEFTGSALGEGWAAAGGWVLVASAILAWYAATALMLAATFGRTILPIGELQKGHPLSPKRAANVPGDQPKRVIQFASGEPGVKQGQ